MPIAVNISPKLDGVPSNYNSPDLREDTSEDDEDTTPALNNIESLKNGIVNVSKNDVKAPYTILVVGETGVGKSSVLELIANVLAGNDTAHYNSNEKGGPTNQSQTNSARMYEFTSKNGAVVRILDTPGLADTHDLQQAELQKKSVAAQIKQHADSITAVLVLANGTVPRLTTGNHHALSVLSAIFPQIPANRVAFMFTNVPSPVYVNFPQRAIPGVLKDAPQFLLDNPVALQKKYHTLMRDPSMRRRRIYFRGAVKAAEQETFGVLVDLFDWLGGLEPQPMVDVVSRYQNISTSRATANKAMCSAGMKMKMAQEKVQEGLRKVMQYLTG